MVEKYYTVDVTCEYSESRVVVATSELEAIKKAKKNDYLGVLGSSIGNIRTVKGVTRTSAEDISEMQYRLKTQQKRK
jgi:hypothetical protein